MTRKPPDGADAPGPWATFGVTRCETIELGLWTFAQNHPHHCYRDISLSFVFSPFYS
jgi:hypothetical protein